MFYSKLFSPREVDRKRILEPFGLDACGYDHIVLFVGKFTQWKGIEYLIGAAQYYTAGAALTLICGNGGEGSRERYNELTSRFGLERSVKIITPPDNRPDIIDEVLSCTANIDHSHQGMYAVPLDAITARHKPFAGAKALGISFSSICEASKAFLEILSNLQEGSFFFSFSNSRSC